VRLGLSFHKKAQLIPFALPAWATDELACVVLHGSPETVLCATVEIFETRLRQRVAEYLRTTIIRSD
jgi:hypothetical protein